MSGRRSGRVQPEVCDRCEHWIACEGEPSGPELLAAAC